MMAGTPAPVASLGRRLLGDRGLWWYRHLNELRRMRQDEKEPRYRASIKRLQALKDRHLGQRCFIIGNGPSLKKTNLALLKNEFTFGLNRIYLLFKDIGFATTYCVTVNRLVVEQCATELAALPCPKFISWHSRDLIRFTDDMMFLDSRPQPTFYTDVTQGVWEGATVTYVAMQVAYFLGFQRVVLVGVDHSFATQGQPHATVVSQGDDPNHFDPQYFGKGFRWQLPDLETSEMAYRIARWQYGLAGREIVDATIGGHLQVFPKVEYESLFK